MIVPLYYPLSVQVVVDSDVIPKLVPLLDSKDSRVLVCYSDLDFLFSAFYKFD